MGRKLGDIQVLINSVKIKQTPINSVIIKQTLIYLIFIDFFIVNFYRFFSLYFYRDATRTYLNAHMTHTYGFWTCIGSTKMI